jgi:hypothetical protein
MLREDEVSQTRALKPLHDMALAGTFFDITGVNFAANG